MSRLFEKRSEKSAVDAAPPAPITPEFSNEQRHTLLSIAHEGIISSVEGRKLSDMPPSMPGLAEPRGVFTTLSLRGQLRGCVGYATPVSPLYRAVAETAQAAAFEDSRFSPVTNEEARELEISLSVLSPLFPIQPEAVDVGRHGLVISLGIRRGLLLPQVPTEHGWNRKMFLEQTCHKAGLPHDAWRKGAVIEAFVAEVFSDADVELP